MKGDPATLGLVTEAPEIRDFSQEYAFREDPTLLLAANAERNSFQRDKFVHWCVDISNSVFQEWGRRDGVGGIVK